MLDSMHFLWMVRDPRARKTVAVEEWRSFGTASVGVEEVADQAPVQDSLGC